MKIFEMVKGKLNYTEFTFFISVFNQLDAQNLFYNKFYFLPLHVSSTCAHYQEVQIALNITPIGGRLVHSRLVLYN